MAWHEAEVRPDGNYFRAIVTLHSHAGPIVVAQGVYESKKEAEADLREFRSLYQYGRIDDYGRRR